LARSVKNWINEDLRGRYIRIGGDRAFHGVQIGNRDKPEYRISESFRPCDHTTANLITLTRSP